MVVGGPSNGDRDREVPMRLRHRVMLGLALTALAVAVPANRWLLVYAGLARRWRRLRRAYTRSRVECSSTRVTYSRKTARRATTTSWSTVTLLYRDAPSTGIVTAGGARFKAGASGRAARKCQEADTWAVAPPTVPADRGRAC